MAVANPLWGAPRIHGELLKLGFEVSERTISRLMPRRRTPPSQTLADVPREPSRLDRRHRLLRGANAHLPDPIRLRRPRPRPAAHPACQCDAASHVRMDPTATPRGLPRRRRPRGSSSTTATRPSTRRSVGRSRPSVSRPSAPHLARPGRIPTSNASSARSAASVWTTSSSSMSGIFVGSFGPTSRTTSGLERTSRSARMRRRNAPSNRPARIVVRPEVGGLHHRYERQAA